LFKDFGGQAMKRHSGIICMALFNLALFGLIPVFMVLYPKPTAGQVAQRKFVERESLVHSLALGHIMERMNCGDILACERAISPIDLVYARHMTDTDSLVREAKEQSVCERDFAQRVIQASKQIGSVYPTDYCGSADQSAPVGDR
jgi:hypothetical protein